MTHLMSTLKTSGRAALVALTLGVVTLSASPASAQAFNFQFGVGPDGKPSVGFGVNTDDDRRGGPRRGYRCLDLSDRQIERGIAREGYRDVSVVRDLPRDRAGVVARDGRTWYSMRVDRCTGETDRIERLRNYRSGMRFQFNF